MENKEEDEEELVETLDQFTILSNRLLNGNNDTSWNYLRGILKFIESNVTLKKYLESIQNKEYTEPDFEDGREHGMHYQIPGDYEGGISYVYQMLCFYAREAVPDYEYLNLAYGYGPSGYGNIDAGIQEFHRIVLLPFLDALQKLLKRRIDQKRTARQLQPIIAIQEFSGSLNLNREYSATIINHQNYDEARLLKLIKQATADLKEAHVESKQEILEFLETIAEQAILKRPKTSILKSGAEKLKNVADALQSVDSIMNLVRFLESVL